MLDYAIKQGRLIKSITGEIKDKNFEDESIDIVVVTEVLEHIKDYNLVLKRIYDMLKNDGILIMSIPYDTTFSLWKPLFKIQCFVQWKILRQLEYKNEAGHINHFSPEKIKIDLESNNFKIIKLSNTSRFTIFIQAKK
jgi:2-polyprenyl-3-methyl-5-hydroxy-6-metoxy-1,4-benzoquinol methylase